MKVLALFLVSTTAGIAYVEGFYGTALVFTGLSIMWLSLVAED